MCCGCVVGVLWVCCGCVCLFSIEIQTAGQIGMKFGMEVVLKGGKVLGGQPGTPQS